MFFARGVERGEGGICRPENRWCECSYKRVWHHVKTRKMEQSLKGNELYPIPTFHVNNAWTWTFLRETDAGFKKHYKTKCIQNYSYSTKDRNVYRKQTSTNKWHQISERVAKYQVTNLESSSNIFERVTNWSAFDKQEKYTFCRALRYYRLLEWI